MKRSKNRCGKIKKLYSELTLIFAGIDYSQVKNDWLWWWKNPNEDSE
jgi:hypothetical protein